MVKSKILDFLGAHIPSSNFPIQEKSKKLEKIAKNPKNGLILVYCGKIGFFFPRGMWDVGTTKF